VSEVPVKYVLITPARNEEAFIEKTIESVAKQTILPLKWVIVNDGSTDDTGNKVRRFLGKYPWIELIEFPVRKERNFAAKVFAFNAGQESVKNLDYEVIANLDADTSFDADHFEFLLNEFRKNPRLGVAGTIFKEDGYSSETDSFEGENHVSGQCQLFRRQCFEEIGGYRPNKAGGIDWMAVTSARMMGWQTRSFREKWFFHHRKLGTAERGRLKSSFSYGEKDYYLGGHPVWEALRVAFRMTRKPYLIDGAALGSGFLWAFLSRQKRAVSKELMKFHRKEQMQKLKAILGSMMRFKGVDSFQVKTTSGTPEKPSR
jgi:glycosyltransferase involved in cell wall biosynthesis